MADTVSTKSTNDDHNATVIGQEHVSQDINTDERYSASGADFRDITNLNAKRTYDLHQTLDTDAILAARRLQTSEEAMRMRHAEDLHKQALRHSETEHVVKIQTLQVGSVGNSKIIEEIATSAANSIIAMVRTSVAK